jgi:hypothetical protein
MGDVSDAQRLPAAAVAWPLPWGPVVRGVRRGEGAAVALLLHEPGADLDAWGHLPDQLARALPLTVIALDLPGHGLSDDPWEPERLGDLIQFALDVTSRSNPSPDIDPHPNPSPIAMGEGLSRYRSDSQPQTRKDAATPLSRRAGRGGQGGEGSRRETGWYEGLNFLIAAGSTATSALVSTAELPLNGVVLLSLEAPDPDIKLSRSPRVPKLLVAGSLAGDDLQTARRLSAQCGGWSVVTALPVAARGTELLVSPWSAQLVETVVAFLRDCARRPALARMPPPRG